MKNKKFTKAELFTEFVTYIPKDTAGNISFNDWVYFYVDFSNTITCDNNFSKMLELTWGIPEQDDPQATKEELRFIVKMVRTKLIQSTGGVDDEFKLMHVFKSIDSTNSVSLTPTSA